jgi:hypothetical protein
MPRRLQLAILVSMMPNAREALATEPWWAISMSMARLSFMADKIAPLAVQ